MIIELKLDYPGLIAYFSSFEGDEFVDVMSRVSPAIPHATEILSYLFAAPNLELP